MAERTPLTKDYTNAPVPDEATIHGLRIAMVVAGIGATLPMFLLGSQIAVGRGLRLAVPVCFAACALVGLLGTLTSIVGSRSRLSTYQVVTFAFGVRGARLVNLVLGAMLIGWFATTGQMLGAAIQHAVAGIHGTAWPQWIYTVGSLTAMTLTGIFGFRVMERFVRVTVPLLAALMAYVVWLSLLRGGLTAALSRLGDDSLSTVDALSSVIGAIILTAVLAPDLTRYARNDRHALLSVLGLVVGFPTALIMLAGVYVVDFFGVNHQRYDLGTIDSLSAVRASAFAAWVLGSAAGLAGTYYRHSLTSIPAGDSILIAAVAYFIMSGGLLRRLASGKP